MQITNSKHANTHYITRFCVCETLAVPKLKIMRARHASSASKQILTRVMEIMTHVSISNLSISQCVTVRTSASWLRSEAFCQKQIIYLSGKA